MKFIYKSMYSALLMGAMGLNATAQQQLPNSGFETEWIKSIPWITNNGNTKDKGTTPEGWCISNVIGINGLGATEVGTKDAGYNSNTAVKLTNSPNSFLSSQTVPGYITLGTTWSTSVMGSKNDGGSFGGIEFSGRPEKLEFMYKHTSVDGEKATVVAYLLKGHWTQKNVPGTIEAFGTTKTADMIDRDRCVLQMDMSGSLGGDVIPSDDAELIAVINVEIPNDVAREGETNADEWKKFSVNFDYKSEATPEYINVILSAGNYFGGASAIKQGTALTIDDVKLIYPAQSYNGYLNIKMGVMDIETNKDATIYITPTSEDKCTFKLPNFMCLGTIFGDIVVEDVVVTEKDGEKYYTGSVNGLILKPEGADEGQEINANVSLSGTTDNMKIDVIWIQDPTDPTSGMPIDVTFTKNPVGDETNGITDITVDNSNAPVEFFNLQGMRVNAENLTPGIYVRRQGSSVSKVLVK